MFFKIVNYSTLSFSSKSYWASTTPSNPNNAAPALFSVRPVLSSILLNLFGSEFCSFSLLFSVLAVLLLSFFLASLALETIV